MALRLDDGTSIIDLGRPRQGTRHRVLFGIEEGSGREVAVKIESLPGALEPERRALEWLGVHDGPSPRLRVAGTVVSAEDRGAVCLVTDRVEGEAPRSPAGWERLGRALARLSDLPWEGSGLEVRNHRAFLAVHQARIDEVGAALRSDPRAKRPQFDLGTKALQPDLRAILPLAPTSYPDSPLVVTHGDPGPGNFLDDGAAGTLIDWEDALVAPRGLDLGRAAFIALLGSGPEGYEAEDQMARARAVIAGFLDEGDGSPGPDELRWWLGVAGVQFAHRRLERAGAPGVLPWPDAVTVLEGALEDPAGWSPDRA